MTMFECTEETIIIPLFDEGLDLPFPSLLEEFSMLMAQFSDALALLPAGDVREQFVALLPRTDHLRQRLEIYCSPLPF